jgi:N-acetylglucosaminyl-diphospho-decaprenol L-rhamnosyltransferase
VLRRAAVRTRLIRCRPSERSEQLLTDDGNELSGSIRATDALPMPSVIVLTYNSSSTLAACLTALLPQIEHLGGELLVADNGSTDTTRDVAASCGIDAIDNGGNLGFAAGCNAAARRATGEVLVFVNPDAVVGPGALAALCSAAQELGIGPLGGRAQHADGSYDRRSAHGIPSLRGALSFAIALDRIGRGRSWADPEGGPLEVPSDGSLRPVPAVSGAVTAVPRTLWEQLGGFDESFFLYGEDIDLSIRATRLGWRPTVVTGAGYLHTGGVSSADGTTRDVWLYRGKVELYRRHLPVWSARLAVIGLQVGVLMRGLPALLGTSGVAARARPWWTLFGRRREWRVGYRDHHAGRAIA